MCSSLKVMAPRTFEWKKKITFLIATSSEFAKKNEIKKRYLKLVFKICYTFGRSWVIVTCWDLGTPFYHVCQFLRPQFEFSWKVKRMRSNPGNLLRFVSLYHFLFVCEILGYDQMVAGALAVQSPTYPGSSPESQNLHSKISFTLPFAF